MRTPSEPRGRACQAVLVLALVYVVVIAERHDPLSQVCQTNSCRVVPAPEIHVAYFDSDCYCVRERDKPLRYAALYGGGEDSIERVCRGSLRSPFVMGLTFRFSATSIARLKSALFEANRLVHPNVSGRTLPIVGEMPIPADLHQPGCSRVRKNLRWLRTFGCLREIRALIPNKEVFGLIKRLLGSGGLHVELASRIFNSPAYVGGTLREAVCSIIDSVGSDNDLTDLFGASLGAGLGNLNLTVGEVGDGARKKKFEVPIYAHVGRLAKEFLAGACFVGCFFCAVYFCVGFANMTEASITSGHYFDRPRMLGSGFLVQPADPCRSGPYALNFM